MEAIVVKASSEALKMLYPVLANELSLQWYLEDDVRDIQPNFELMMALLKEVDRYENRSHLVKAWVKDVRDTAYNVEEVIDKFIYQFHDRQRGGCRSLLCSIICLPIEYCIIRRGIAAEVRRFKDRVFSILKDKNQLIGQISDGAAQFGAHNTCRERNGCPLLGDEEIVGIKEKIDSLVRLLVDGDKGRRVISVTGMGGLGKTTLVLKAYRSIDVQNFFDCRAYLSVSQPFNIEEVLRSLMNELKMKEADAKMNTQISLLKVNEYLKSKSYVVVLDDVWNTEDWNQLKHAFPSSQQCPSRIMLTTRKEKVASSLGDGSCRFPLEPLDFEDAWDLFCKKAFPEGTCDPKVEICAQKFVERCEGLPLSIVSIGGLLASTDHYRWETIYNTLNSELAENDMLQMLNHMIFLSFYDLPYHLQHCFLYFSIFPEDHIIHRKKLIRLWIAEGFVEQKDGSTLEEVAEGYLIELIKRSMIQLVETNEFGRVKTCRIHDIAREIAIAKSKDKRFSMVYCGEQETSSNAKIRRLSICEKEKCFESNKGMEHLRSLHVFDKNLSSSSLDAMLSKFKWLKVLDLQGVAIESVPNVLTDLILLRYLNLRRTKVKKLPKSLDKLIYLQTLDLKDTQIDKLPNGIVKLQNLRHLYFHCRDGAFYSGFHPIRVPKEICHLEGLHSLSMVEANEKIIRELGNLSKLRRFGVDNLRAVDGEKLCKYLVGMEHLQNLSICSTGENESIKLDSLSSPPSPLRKLTLKGRLEKVPHWLTSVSLAKLTYLRLHDSQLEENQLSLLKQLDQVVVLVLVKAYNGNQLSFPDGSFPELRKLYLHTWSQLSHVHIAPGAMKSIREMNLLYCSELKTVPEGIENVNLQKLYLVNMPEELIRRMQIDGQDRGRIQHIPYVKHANGRGGETFFEKLV